MKLPLICVSFSLMLIEACATSTERTYIHLSDGRDAILLDDTPSAIKQRAAELCPYGYQAVSFRAYEEFPHIAHEQMTIVCDPLPKDFPQ